MFLLETTLAKTVTSLNWSFLLQLSLFSEVTESLSHLAQKLLPQQDSKSNGTHFTISVLYFVQQPSSTIKQRRKVLRIFLRCGVPPAATHSIKPLILQHDHNAATLFFRVCPFSLSGIRYSFSMSGSCSALYLVFPFFAHSYHVKHRIILWIYSLIHFPLNLIGAATGTSTCQGTTSLRQWDDPEESANKTRRMSCRSESENTWNNPTPHTP